MQKQRSNVPGADNQSSTSQATRFDIKISTKAYTQRTAKAPSGFHIASSAEIILIEKTNKEVQDLLPSFIMTKETGDALHNGPCRILQDGTREQLFSDWSDDLPEERQNAYLAEFQRLPPDEKAWEIPGSQGKWPVVVTRYLGGKDDPNSGMIQVYANQGIMARGYLVYVKDVLKESDAAQDAETEAEKFKKVSFTLSSLMRKYLPPVITELTSIPALDPIVLETLRILLRAAEVTEADVPTKTEEPIKTKKTTKATRRKKV